jgi:hypothetical protein
MTPVADMFDEIRKRREEIAREEGKAPTSPTWVPPASEEEKPLEDYACGWWDHGGFPWRKVDVAVSMEQAIKGLDAEVEAERRRLKQEMDEYLFNAWGIKCTPGEFTDGA